MSSFHSFKQWTTLLSVLLLSTTVLANGTLPEGWDQTTLEKVLNDKIVTKTLKDDGKEIKQVKYAYFHEVTTDEYIKLATNHKKYVPLFTEVKSATTTKTVKVSESETKFHYVMAVSVDLGIYIFDVKPDPVGYHLATYGKTIEDEASLLHELTNHKDKLSFARQTTKLTPYKGGILIIEEIYGKVKNPSWQSKMILKELKKFFSKYIATFKKELDAYKD